jgi:tight adherence protein B
MNVLIVIIFLGAFSVVALLMTAGGGRAAKDAKRTLATLDSAISAISVDSRDQLLDLRKRESFSAIPLLNKLLHNLELAPRLRSLLNQADLKWTAGGLLLGCATCFIASSYLVYLRFHVVLIAMLVGGVIGCAPLFFVFQKRSRRFGKFEQELPDALALMVSALRVGHSLNSALSLVTREAPEPIKSEFRICFDEQNYGLELRTAMENMTNRVPLQDLRIVVTAILIQKESGGNLAEVLEKVAYVIRERFRLKRQVMTHTAQGRLTGWILSLMPVVLGFALYTVNPKTMSILWTNPIGIKLLYASVAMIVIGSLIIRKIVKMDI